MVVDHVHVVHLLVVGLKDVLFESFPRKSKKAYHERYVVFARGRFVNFRVPTIGVRDLGRSNSSFFSQQEATFRKTLCLL